MDFAAHEPEIDPRAILESLVAELECMLVDSSGGSSAELVTLHGALLAYNLGGDAALLPDLRFGWSKPRFQERRVLGSARRIMAQGGGDHEATMDRASQVIDEHLHLIDPGLRSRVA